MTRYSKKVCLLGDFYVGKTSLVRRFVYDLFDDKYLTTIGVKVSRKTVAVPRQADVADLTMMLWDMSGGEEFTQVRTSYLRGAAGAVLVGDLTRQETFDVLETYANDLYEISPKAQIILAANKCDLNGLQQLTEDQVKTFADALGAPYCLTSAKTGDAVETLFRDLGRLLVT